MPQNPIIYKCYLLNNDKVNFEESVNDVFT